MDAVDSIIDQNIPGFSMIVITGETMIEIETGIDMIETETGIETMIGIMIAVSSLTEIIAMTGIAAIGRVGDVGGNRAKRHERGATGFARRY
jgi:hypothetical protein